MPIRLWHDGYPQSCCLERPAYDGCTEGRMVDVGITGKQDDIKFIPSS